MVGGFQRGDNIAIIRCSGCGMKIKTSKGHERTQIFAHRLECAAYVWPDSQKEKVIRTIGYHLSKVARNYE